MVAFGVWAAIRTVKDRVGTWVGYARAKELAPELTREEWGEAIGQARSKLKSRTEEITKPLGRRPVGSEIDRYESKRATGFYQQLEIFVRDRDTGLVESRHYVVKTDTIRSRQAIIDMGLSKYQEAAADSPDDYPEEVLGAAYVGTIELFLKKR